MLKYGLCKVDGRVFLQTFLSGVQKKDRNLTVERPNRIFVSVFDAPQQPISPNLMWYTEVSIKHSVQDLQELMYSDYYRNWIQKQVLCQINKRYGGSRYD